MLFSVNFCLFKFVTISFDSSNSTFPSTKLFCISFHTSWNVPHHAVFGKILSSIVGTIFIFVIFSLKFIGALVVTGIDWETLLFSTFLWTNKIATIIANIIAIIAKT